MDVPLPTLLPVAKAVTQSASDITSLCNTLQKLAAELTSLRESRSRTAANFAKAIGTKLPADSPGSSPEVTQSPGARSSGSNGRRSRLRWQDEDEEGYPVNFEHSERPRGSSRPSDMQDGESMDSMPSRGTIRWSIASSAPAGDSMLPMQSAYSTRSMAYTATTVEDPWVGEIIDRISGALERSSRDPQEIFFRFCSPGLSCLQKADLARAVKTFAPELPESHRSKLWEALSKDEDEHMDFEEFSQLFRVRPPQPCLRMEWTPTSPRNHQDLIVRYRFGRALRSRSAARQALFNICSEEGGIKVHKVLDICDQYKLPLSQQELVAFFMKHKTGEAVSRGVLEEAITLATGPTPLQEMQWVQEVLTSVGAQARARGCGIGGELAQLGDAVAAPFLDLRQVLASQLSLDEEHWEVLHWSLDKRKDGDIFLEPVMQLATKMCDDSEVAD